MKDIDELLKNANESIEVEYVEPAGLLSKIESQEEEKAYRKPFWTKPKMITVSAFALASIAVGFIVPFSLNRAINNTPQDSNVLWTPDGKYATTLKLRANPGEFSMSQENVPEFKGFVKKINNYACPLFENINNSLNSSKKNAAYSPASIYYALSMLTKVVGNNDKEKLLPVLGATEEELNAYLPSLFRACNRTFVTDGVTLGKERVDNSIWLDDRFDFNPNIVNDLGDTYFTSLFAGNFEENSYGMNRSISDYVNKTTEGLLSPAYDFDRSTAFVLLNTLYFQDVWNREGLPLSKAGKDTFLSYDGESKSLDYYYTYFANGKVHEAEKYVSMFTTTYNGFKIDFMMPKDGVSVDELFTEEMLREHENINYVSKEIDEENTDSDNVRYVEYYTRFKLPEFEAAFDSDIVSCIYDTYGINGITDFYDFVTPKGRPYEGFAINQIIHSTKVEVKKDSIKGAAATATDVKPGSALPPRRVYADLVIDRPFVYTIKDSLGIKLFEGVVYNI